MSDQVIETKTSPEVAALENGGRRIAWSDANYVYPNDLPVPGRGKDMGDGRETRRRREPGNDWCLIALGHSGEVSEVLVDTAHFKGTYPAAAPGSHRDRGCIVKGAAS